MLAAPLFLAATLALSTVLGSGCEARSAKEIFPQYVQKKQAGESEDAAEASGSRTPGRAPTFFPGRRID
jgi:hypothetical protein